MRFEQRKIESFLALHHTMRTWKNRQRVRVSLPLFPGYVFVRIDRQHRSAVVQTPGVIYVVGSKQQAEISGSEICFLSHISAHSTLEPYPELVVGERVRIKAGVMKGLEGVLVRKKERLRLVLTVNMINQSAVLEVNAEDIETVH
jgi:transcription antitermination factor NusG